MPVVINSQFVEGKKENTQSKKGWWRLDKASFVWVRCRWLTSSTLHQLSKPEGSIFAYTTPIAPSRLLLKMVHSSVNARKIYTRHSFLQYRACNSLLRHQMGYVTIFHRIFFALVETEVKNWTSAERGSIVERKNKSKQINSKAKLAQKMGMNPKKERRKQDIKYFLLGCDIFSVGARET